MQQKLQQLPNRLQCHVVPVVRLLPVRLLPCIVVCLCVLCCWTTHCNGESLVQDPNEQPTKKLSGGEDERRLRTKTLPAISLTRVPVSTPGQGERECFFSRYDSLRFFQPSAQFL
jgi:hypothetical protein